MFPFHATLRDIQEVIRVAADPLSSAHLAMTCRFEHAARYEYYTRHHSGPRTRARYYILGVAAYGTDDMLLDTLRFLSTCCRDGESSAAGEVVYQGARDTRLKMILVAVEAGREPLILAWGRETPRAIKGILEDYLYRATREIRDAFLSTLSYDGLIALYGVADRTTKDDSFILFHEFVADPDRRRRIMPQGADSWGFDAYDGGDESDLGNI